MLIDRFKNVHLFYGSLHALGIGAASFASHAGTGTGIRGRERETGTGIRERGGDGASKDIAESPTAQPERPKQCKINN